MYCTSIAGWNSASTGCPPTWNIGNCKDILTELEMSGNFQSKLSKCTWSRGKLPARTCYATAACRLHCQTHFFFDASCGKMTHEVYVMLEQRNRQAIKLQESANLSCLICISISSRVVCVDANIVRIRSDGQQISPKLWGKALKSQQTETVLFCRHPEMAPVWKICNTEADAHLSITEFYFAPYSKRALKKQERYERIAL